MTDLSSSGTLERRLSPSRVALLGCGFIGAALAEGLHASGFEVTALSRSFAPGIDQVLEPGQMIVGEVADRACLRSVLAGADTVVFCVGGISPAMAEADPGRDARSLLDPLRVVLDELSRRPSVRLVHLSSGGAIYGDAERLPVSEDSALRPIGAYGRSRREAERLILGERDAIGAPTLVLRCANAYGPRQPLDRGQGAVGLFLHRVARGLPIEMFGHGDEVRDYVHIADVADAVAKLIESGQSGIFNVGSGCGTTTRELTGLVSSALGRAATIVHLPRRSFDVRGIVLDICRLQRVIDFQPRPLGPALDTLAGDRQVAIA